MSCTNCTGYACSCPACSGIGRSCIRVTCRVLDAWVHRLLGLPMECAKYCDGGHGEGAEDKTCPANPRAYTSDEAPRRVLTEAIVSFPWQPWETCGYLHDDPCQGATLAVTAPAHEICWAIIRAALDAGLIGGG